ncbi:MAG: mechanosensitive ion channel [Okeania sp. SIO3I5]|uniref:mechanosensitive ion channel family protein n=1 Tax=Okeania sp. SIO3I5 TaxID=2607805 RepID=UPI0013B8C944|nr:mechanosensitive ion channel domain-containing protein [Okeania sp. SIO3I5]NEQ41360.1 mechanosensitive ion channel [Okeania sp. SIO3I5]
MTLSLNYLELTFNFHLYVLTVEQGLKGISIKNINFQTILQTIIALLLAYGFLISVKFLSQSLSESVPLRFRAAAKQSDPFLQALILFTTTIYVLSLFLQLSTQNLLAITGTIAVALGFAFKDYVSSLIAGVVALFETPYRVGDRVKIGDNYGEIISYDLRGIRLLTIEDNMIFIPHNKIWNEPISNSNSGALEAQVTTDFYLAHEVDSELAIKILYLAAYTSKYTQLKLPIRVLVEEKPWGTQFQLKSYPIDARDEYIYKTDLVRRVKQAFAKHDFTYPQSFLRKGVGE